MEHGTRHTSSGRYLVLIVLLACLGWTAQVLAAEITGQWEMSMDFGGRQSFATLSVARKADGTLTARWGRDELSNVKFDGQRLTFTRTIRFGDNEFTMDYAGTLKDGKITGMLSSDRGEFSANGTRIKPKPAVVGVWDLAYSIGDRDMTSRLTVSEKPGGTLDAQWASQRGDSAISNVKLQNGKLTFDRTVRFNDREFTMTFEGTAQGDTLAGASKSDRGEIPVTGTRFGAALIGRWELAITTDQGTMPGSFTVFPDLTARQEFFGGEIPVKDLKLDGDQVTYALELGFDDQTFRIDYKLTLQGNTLTGQSSSARGTNDISGKKAMPASPAMGTWEFTRETQRGTRTSTLTINADMTGTYTVRDNEVPVTDLEIEGDQVSFKLAMTFGDREVTMEFKGKVDGATLTGEFTTARGAREAVGTKVE
jgi:hypothetical protein